MAVKTIRIGSAEDIHQYDNLDFTEAMDTDDEPIKIGQSTNGDEALRQDQLPALGTMLTSDNVIADNAVVRGAGGARKVQDSGVIIDDNDNLDLNAAVLNGLLAAITSGGLEYSSNRFYITNVAHRRAIDRTSDVNLSTVTVENTIVETTIWTATMNANSLVAGNVFKFHADGHVQNGGPTAADRVTLRIKVGGTTMVTMNPIAGTIAVGSHWHIDANATQRTVGIAGSRAIHVDVDLDGTTSETISVGVINTTANMDVTLTVEWASADINNIFELFQAFMEYKN